MEILTKKQAYQAVGEQTVGSNECIIKSEAISLAESHRKNITVDLSGYLDNEYIDKFEVEDKPDLSNFVFANKQYNPTADGLTATTTATSLDIDGNVIDYTATSDVSWIHVTVKDDKATITVDANSGDKRTGHITGTNATGKTDTITIVQEAYIAPLKYTYKLIAKGATGTPIVTINGETITLTQSGDDYVGEYMMRVATEDEAPATVPFTIIGGGTNVSYSNEQLSVSPTSWDLRDGLSKTFTVTYKQDKSTTAWDKASGTIAKDSSVTTTLSTTEVTESPSVSYTVTDTTSSGDSFTISKNGMSFTATASSTNCAPSTITVAAGSKTASISVTYTPPVYDLTWSDGTKAITETTGISAATFTGTVKATVDGTSYSPTLTVTSSQSWLTASANGNNITINCTANSGSTSRTGVVTVADAHANSVTYTVTQDYNAWSHTYTLVATGAGSQPTMTINGYSVTPTRSGSTYTGVYTMSGTGTDNAPSSVNWSISGGLTATTYGSVSISVGSSSWNLDDGLSFSTSVTATRSYTSYHWSTTSGTITRDSSSATSQSSSTGTDTLTPYVKSSPTGVTASISSGTLTASASSTSNTGTIYIATNDGGSESINVYYDPASITYKYTVNVNCSEKPNITIGGESASVSGSGSSWVGTITVSSTTDPGEKSYSVTAGSSGRDWKDCHVSIGPDQTITSKSESVSFTATAYQDYEDYTAYTASGTTSGKTASCTPSRSYSYGSSNSENCSISTSGALSGFPTSSTISANGTTLSGTATGDGTITISLSYGGYSDSDSASVTQKEVWPDWDDESVVYTFEWIDLNNSTSISANDIEWDLSNISDYTTYRQAGILTHRKRVSSLGNPYTEYVQYTGDEKGWPDGNNTSTSSRSDSGTLTQNYSGKTITWSWTQNGKPEEEKTGPYYSWVTDGNFSFETIGGTKSKNYVKYYKKGDTVVDEEQSTYSITKGTLYSTEDASGSESVGDTGLTANWTQNKNSRTTSSGLSRISYTSSNLDASAGSVELFYTFSWSWAVGSGGEVVASGNDSFSYTENPNTTQRDLTFRKSYPGASSGKNDYGLSYPYATCTLVQNGKQIENVYVTVSSIAYPNGGNGGGIVNVGLSQSVPFDVTVSGTATAELSGGDGQLYIAKFSVTISSGSTTAQSTVSFNASSAMTNVTSLISAISPSSQTVGTTQYVLSA